MDLNLRGYVPYLPLKMLILLFSIQILLATTTGLSGNGRTRLFDFSILNSGCRYEITRYLSSNYSTTKICEPHFDISQDGILLYRHSIWRSYSKRCKNDIANLKTLTVKAENCFSAFNVAFKVIVSEAKLLVTIPLIEIHVYSNEKFAPGNRLFDSNRILTLQRRLEDFLPYELVKRFDNSLINSRLVDIVSDWNQYKESHVSNSVSLDAKTRLVVEVRNEASVHGLRYKRQVFSNLHKPKFAQNSYIAETNEEIPIGTDIIQVEATDEDEGSSGTVVYSLHADVDQRSLNLFYINENTGWVTTKGRIDRENITLHQFTVRARDQGSPSNSEQVSLTIRVLDINDHAPRFELPIYNINVSETQSKSYVIERVRADDKDIGKNGEIKYMIIHSESVADFTINRDNGDITIAKALDRENKSNYSFYVKAVDQADNDGDRRTSSVAVNIKIIDSNDNPPKFDKSDYTFQVREDINISSGPAVIGQIVATDADFGANGHVRYSITFGNQLEVFEIDVESGELRVVVPLDRDQRGGGEYNLRVRARDDGASSLSNVVNVKVIVLDVNDNAPSFKYPSSSYNVFEGHVAGNPIATVVATDPDEADNKLLKYSIIPQVRRTQLPIAIDENTGVITNNATLDREREARYEFVVLVQDHGSPPKSATSNITINILDRNDNEPEFTKNIYNAFISEDADVLDEVITVTADDPDENDELTYTIVSGDGSNDFMIIKEQKFGIIKVNKKLSYDNKNFYKLTVRVVDSSGQSSDCIVRVNVTDKNMYTPVFRQDRYNFNISEAADKGTVVGTVQADDADIELNGKVTYFFVHSGQSLPFRINTTTGEVIVNDTLDRDNPRTQDFYIDVIAKDLGLPVLQTPIPAVVHIVIGDINDNAPIFEKTEYTVSISESIGAGSSVVTVGASDADKPGTDNSRVRYTFEGGDNGNGSFYIEYAGGTIRVNKELDRETTSEYELVVYATDMAPLSERRSSSVIVRVTVLDVNDNAPQFESNTIVRRIYENKPERSAVEPAIRATDADLGENAKITFQLVGGDTTAFELKDLNDGSFKLYSKVPLDYESLRKNYTLEVQASSAHMITKATVVVKLQDVNDNRPELKNFTIVVNNYWGHFPDGYIGRVPAFDPDESDRNNLRYTVKSGNEADFFTLNSSTGYIRLNKAIGSNRPIDGNFVVQVSDVLNTVNATLRLIYRLISDEMLTNAVTLRLDDITPTSFMTSMYKYTEQALAAVLELIPSQIYIIDIKADTEVDTSIHSPVLNISFAAVQTVDGKDVYLNQEDIKEQIYRRLDLLKNLSSLTVLPFDDTLCVIEPCLNYHSCTIALKFAEAAPFLNSQTMLFRPIRSKKLYSCSCPTGFVGKDESYNCDTEFNLCYSDPCENSGTCKQVEGGYKCVCPTGYKGERCEYNTLKGEYNTTSCPSEVCSGKGAYCVDLIRGGFACHQEGKRCVETDALTDTCSLRSVSFVPGSYLMFPALRSRLRFNIQLSFATRKKSGLLLYNGRYNHFHDFIALEVIDHRAVLTLSFGDKTYSVSVGNQYGLNDGQWHTVEVDYKDASLVISLDQCDVGLSLQHPDLFRQPCAQRVIIEECTELPRTKLCALDVTGPLLIGGLPEYLSVNDLRLSSSYLVGCISDLYLNYEPVDLNAAVTNHNTQQGCVYRRDFCATSPCRNKGTCVSSWATYKCMCPENTSGRDCSLNTGPSFSFYSIGYLKYASSIESVRKPWYNSFLFKTTVDNKLVMRITLEQRKTIEYKIERGYITFRYADFYYVFDEAIINDDKWHHFEMRLLANSHGQGQILLQLDYGDVQRSEPLDNSLDGLDVLQVWVGGEETTGPANLGYAGCIKDVNVGSNPNSRALDSPARHNVFNGCSKPTKCEAPCRTGAASVCHVGWENSTCLCSEGLYGSTCTSVCSPSYNPCEHGGQCRVDREVALGYRCLCSEGYQGTYCEDQLQSECPASWWGTSVCGPCNCDTELNFNRQCDKLTGACLCKNGYYRPKNSDGCVPCNCYYNAGKGGAIRTSCDAATGQCECRTGVSGRICDACENLFAEATEEGCIVLYNSCPKSYTAGVWWTRTQFGVQRIESCPPGSVGNATRVCKDSEDGWQEPILSACTSNQFLALHDSLLELELRKDGNGSEPVVAVGSERYSFVATRIISKLRNATEQVKNLYTNDLLITVKVLRQILLREKVGKSLYLSHTRDRYFLENLVYITSTALNTDFTDQWVSITKTYKSSALVDLIQDYDDYISNLVDNMATIFVTAGMEPFQIITDNIVMNMDTLRVNGATIPKYNNIKKNDSVFDDATSVILPSKLFTETSDGLLAGKTVCGSLLYKTAAELLVSTSSSENNRYASDIEFNNRVQRGPTYGGIVLNSAVFSLAVQQGERRPVLLVDPIEITFLLRISDQTTNPQCVYLDTQGHWTAESCLTKEVLDDRVICSCLHLSTYALITDFNPNTGALTNHISVHMYIAVAVALLCLMITLLVFVCLKDLKSNYIYNQINLHICFSISLIIYVAGSNSMDNQAACTLVAVMLQFFVLSLFAWIFVNSFHLYRILTEKRRIDGEAMLLYVLIGYVGPGVVTGLSVGLKPEEFGTETLCWLNINQPMVWSLAGPALFCSLAVEVFLILCIIISCQVENITSSNRKKEIKNFKSAIYVSIAALPLTFCTWLFALLNVNSLSDAWSYDHIFSIFTCITALFSLLAHVVFNKRGRSEIQKRWKRCQGHGRLEESESLDKPNNVSFGEYGGGTYGFAGSESSTTSNSRLTSQSPDILAYLRQNQSSTSSDIPTFSQLGSVRGRRRRRAISDCSSDSETDSEIRTEREKDIELASSHSSDEDDPIPPVAYPPPITVKVKPLHQSSGVGREASAPFTPYLSNGVESNIIPYSTPNEDESGFTPPPPNFSSRNTKFSSRLSDSTVSTNGSQSRADSASMKSSHNNNPFNRPNHLHTFTGGSKKVSPSASHQQHTNKSFVNSPSMSDKLGSPQASPAAEDQDGRHLVEINNSLPRHQNGDSYSRQHPPAIELLASQHRASPSNLYLPLPSNQQHAESPLAGVFKYDSDSVRTQSSIKSTQDEVFMPPPPHLSLHLTLQPSSGSASSSVVKADPPFILPSQEQTDLDVLNDVNNETQV